MTKILQLCPVPEGWWAIYDGDKSTDDAREVVAVAVTDAGDAIALVLDTDGRQFINAAALPGFTHLEFEAVEEEEPETGYVRSGDIEKAMSEIRARREDKEK